MRSSQFENSMTLETDMFYGQHYVRLHYASSTSDTTIESLVFSRGFSPMLVAEPTKCVFVD